MEDLEIGRPARGSTTGRPIMVLLDALGRRGALRLIWELRDGRALTFRALVDACESNPGALNTRLKELRTLHLIDHGDGGYHLTEHGRSLATTLAPLTRWADGWAEAVAQDV
ncbi:winged helix-turn-helix transcriptional regulator [Nocardia sp. NPDC020380]|uniref:winged helix-turn-helix transcriptional regulator n=1 Tax=Nocardia sp. NPDC020380 TaxID=3364309 RepID=UPI0037B035E4